MAEDILLHGIDPPLPPTPAPAVSTEPLAVPQLPADKQIEPPLSQEPDVGAALGDPGSSEINPAPPPSDIVFETYGAYREHLEQEHFDLYGRLGSLPLGPKTIYASILDIGNSNEIEQANFSIVRGQSNNDFKLALQNVDQSTKTTRVIILEDINQAAVNVLGGELDLDPTFFFNHIKGSTQDTAHGVNAITVLASTKQVIRQGSEAVDKITRQLALMTADPKPRDKKTDSEPRDNDKEEKRELALSKLREDKSKIEASLEACFVHTELRDQPLQSYQSKYREGIDKHYQSVDWYKMIVVNELQEQFDPDPLMTYRECFNPYIRDLVKYEAADYSNFQIMPSAASYATNPMIYNMLKERNLHSMMTERLSIYDLNIDQQAVTIILCDPLPEHQNRTFYDLWQPRGSWFHETTRLSSTSNVSQSTKDCLVSWFVEAAAKASSGKTPIGTAFPFILELIRRDTLTTLEYVQLRTRRIQGEILSNELPEDNFQAWREWLTTTFHKLTQNNESLDEFLSKYEDSSVDEISTKKKWTSLSTAMQVSADLPTTYYLGGRADNRELVRGRKVIQPLLKKFESAQQILQRTDDLLKNTLQLKESQRAISEAHSVTKLTELAFVFVPLSFAASFLSMPFDILNSSISLATFVVFAIVVLSGAYILRITTRITGLHRLAEKLQTAVRRESELAPGQRIPNSAFITFLSHKFYEYTTTPLGMTISTLFVFFALPVILIWTSYKGSLGLRGGLTAVCFFLWLFTVVVRQSYDGFGDTDFARAMRSSKFWPQGRGSIRLSDATSDVPSIHVSGLVIGWWLLRLCMIPSPLIAPTIIIWVLLPTSVGSKIGLTAAVVLVGPFVWILWKSVFLEQQAGRRVYHSIRQFLRNTLIPAKFFIYDTLAPVKLLIHDTWTPIKLIIGAWAQAVANCCHTVDNESIIIDVESSI